MGQFEFGASGQLLLFTFLACLGGSATLIQARRLGVVSRMLAGPMNGGRSWSPARCSAGGRSALFQGGYLMVATSAALRRRLGSLPLALLVLLLFSLVASGAAILLGTLLENEGAAEGVGDRLRAGARGARRIDVPVGALPRHDAQHLANYTPHAWAYEALADDPAPWRRARRGAAGARRAGCDGRAAGRARQLVAAEEPGAGDVGPGRQHTPLDGCPHHERSLPWTHD